MNLHVGTSGYAYKEWKGIFYPEKISPKEMLRFYGERLNAVEINYTFHHMPTERVLGPWAERVPDDFVFALKVPQVVTHMKRLKDVGEEVDYFFRTVGVLGKKLGTVLFQFPASFQANRPRLEDLLHRIPETAACAFEFRSPTWLDAGIPELLAGAGHTLCTADADETPAQEILGAARWGYVRLRRSDYTDADLSRWAQRVHAQPWERAFIFFKHEDEAKGPGEALRFRELGRRGPTLDAPSTGGHGGARDEEKRSGDRGPGGHRPGRLGRAGRSGGSGRGPQGGEARVHEEWGAAELLDLSVSYWKTCALHAGVKLGVFSALSAGALPVPELAERLKGDARGVGMLLQALAALGLLVKAGDTYANSHAAARFLSRDSPEYLGHILLHHHHLMASWARLPAAVRDGAPVHARGGEGPEAATEEERESFLMGMFNLASALAPRVASEVDLSGRGRLLDVGGGPGTYAIHFCLCNPGLTATVFDLPTTRPFAERTIERFGLGDRVRFVAGNYLEDPLPGRHDVAWLSHVLHAEGPEDCRRLLRKAVSALEPGGALLVHEFLLDDSLDGPLFPALFSLNMLLGTRRGQSYSEGQVREMLSEAGVREVRRLAVRGPNDSGVLSGVT